MSEIHDLGYKRYVGSRQEASQRWRVIMRNTIANGWQTFFRYKAWLGAAVIVTAIAAVFIFIATSKAWHLGYGLQATFADMALPFAFDLFAKIAFILSLRLGATIIATDFASGAFVFYFARSTRPIDYLVGKLAGYFLLVGVIMIGGPILIALMRIGFTGYNDVSELVPQLWLLPEVIAVGLVGAIVYTAVPLGFSAMIANPRYSLGVWAGWYVIAGSMATGIGHVIHMPLGALDIGHAFHSVTAYALGNPIGIFGQRLDDLPLAACLISLGVQSALAIFAIMVQLNHAQRSGVGGTT
jgi:hypothetical protein